MIDKSSLAALEYEKILDRVSSYAVSKLGKRYVLETAPCDSYDLARQQLDECDQADKLMYSYVISPDFSVDDISEILKKADKLVTLSMLEILLVARNLRVSRLDKEMIMGVNAKDVIIIQDYANGLYDDQAFEEEIYKCILSESEMSDNASYELKNIRSAILRTNEQIKQKLNSYVSSSAYNKYLQDNLVTMRNNRYCLPVKSECRSQIQGLIHDQSASMATVFVEPFAIVEMNNELANLKIAENAEIERILKVFTVKISGSVKELLQNNSILAILDCIFAKAIYAHKNHAVKPELTQSEKLNIVRGRHPLIDKDKVVPISIAMDEKSRIIIISGSNTGGKTVTMKLVGLSTLMAMSGIFPFAGEGSVFKYFDNVFCDIGDRQSIEMNLSTFSSHISNLVHITDNLTRNNLVMLDELGAGTDPTEGAGLAVAVTKTLIDADCFALITTHFTEMKNLSDVYSCVVCASMDFNPISYAPTYRLIMRSSGASNALKIAKRLGLKQEILDMAASQMPKEKLALEGVMEKAEMAKRYAEDYKDETFKIKQDIERLHNEARAEREALAKDRDKLNEKLKREANIAIKEYLEEADDLIEELKQCLHNGEVEDLFKARKLKSQLGKLEYDEESERPKKFVNTPIAVGDIVFVVSLNSEGEILAIDERKKEYTVAVGRVQSKMKYNQVKKIISDKLAQKSEPKVNFAKKEFTNVATPLELNIIGKNTQDGVLELEGYLDSAVLAGYTEVRIVHGKGTGILRKAVGEYLKRCDKVKAHRLGNWGEGDTGVTIVTLK